MWADREIRTVGVWGEKEKWENEEEVGKTSECLHLADPKSSSIPVLFIVGAQKPTNLSLGHQRVQTVMSSQHVLYH